MGVVIALVFAVFQVVGYHSNTQPPADNDVYRYTVQAHAATGADSGEAVRRAAVDWCRAQFNHDTAARRVEGAIGVQPNPRVHTDCLNWLINNDSTTERYKEIFYARPGYPFAASLVAPLTGVWAALWIVSLGFALAGGALVLLLVRLAGGSNYAAWVGEVLFFSLPTGSLGVQRLTDGPAVTVTLATLAGAVLLACRQSILPGVLTLCGALALGYFVRYSAFTLLCTALLAASLLCLARRRLRNIGTIVLAGVSIAGVVGITVGTRLMGWPGAKETLQDTFTDHFKQPDVADPLHRLIGLNIEFWSYAPWQSFTLAFLPVGLCGLSFAALWRTNATFALLATAAALTGVLTVLAHPVFGQFPRLVLPIWILPELGLPFLVFRRQRHDSDGLP
ncbi:hypothetical protein IPZ58_29950 [Streptomyces roseoverticillatus]|uniref:hypothetical protein n=1 Tax=Streptomyces roseoverticillatus TaxID=66429 RepID=UPI001F3EF52B|nr:hypothetical protein [Streptomyces roseoverticillatus]MCF3105778.1 hypothetical protein [Streptomyces roseoverticillatus]